MTRRGLRYALLIAFLFSMPAGYISASWPAQPAASDDLNLFEALNPVAMDARNVQVAPGYVAKFAAAPSKFTHTVTNPFPDTAGFLFARMDAIRYTADGGLLVAARAGWDASFNAVATGAWTPPDGSVRALPVHNLYNTILCSKTNGEFRRVLYGTKLDNGAGQYLVVLAVITTLRGQLTDTCPMAPPAAVQASPYPGSPPAPGHPAVPAARLWCTVPPGAEPASGISRAIAPADAPVAALCSER